MNEQALKDSYELFKQSGYSKSFDDYVELMNTNEDAFKDSYNLFKQSGYSKSIDDYKGLILPPEDTSQTQSETQNELSTTTLSDDEQEKENALVSDSISEFKETQANEAQGYLEHLKDDEKARYGDYLQKTLITDEDNANIEKVYNEQEAKIAEEKKKIGFFKGMRDSWVAEKLMGKREITQKKSLDQLKDELSQKKRANYFNELDNPEERKKVEKVLKAQRFAKDTHRIVREDKIKQYNQQAEPLLDKYNSLKDNLKELDNLCKNAKTVSELNHYKELLEETKTEFNKTVGDLKGIAEKSKAVISEIEDDTKAIGTFEQELSLAKRNYQSFSNALDNLQIQGEEIVSHLDYRYKKFSNFAKNLNKSVLTTDEAKEYNANIDKEMAEKSKLINKQAIEQNKIFADRREYFEPSKQWEDVHSTGDFLQFSTDSLLDSAGIMAEFSMGVPGMVMFALENQAGNEVGIREGIEDRKNELIETKKQLETVSDPKVKEQLETRKKQLEDMPKISELNMFLVSGANTLTELATAQFGKVRILKKAKRAFKSLAKKEVTEGVRASISKRLAKGGFEYLKDGAGEGLEELVSGYVQNVLDIEALGIKFNQDGSRKTYIDNLVEQGMGGFGSGLLMSSPQVGVKVYKDISTTKSRNRISKNVAEINKLSKLLEGENLDFDQQKILGERIQKLMYENENELQSTFTKFDHLDIEDKKQLRNIISEEKTLQIAIDEFSNKKDSSPELISELTEKAKVLENKKELLLQKNSAINHINGEEKTDAELQEFLKDDKNVQAIIDGKADISVQNNEKLSKEVSDRINQLKGVDENTQAEETEKVDTEIKSLEKEVMEGLAKFDNKEVDEEVKLYAEQDAETEKNDAEYEQQKLDENIKASKEVKTLDLDATQEKTNTTTNAEVELGNNNDTEQGQSEKVQSTINVKESEADVKVEKQLTDVEKRKNRLIDLKNQFNRLTKHKKSSKNGQLLNQKILHLSSELGFTIKPLSNGKLNITYKDGKNVGKTNIKEVIPDAKTEDVNYAKAVIEAGHIVSDGRGMRVDLGITQADVKKGINDINKGNYKTTPAKRLIQGIKEAKEQGGFNIKEGMGGQIQNSFVPIDYVNDNITVEMTNDEVAAVEKNKIKLENEFNDWFNNLTEKDQLKELEHYEQKNNTREISSNTTDRESKNNVQNEAKPRKEIEEREVIARRDRLRERSEILNKVSQGELRKRSEANRRMEKISKYLRGDNETAKREGKSSKDLTFHEQQDYEAEKAIEYAEKENKWINDASELGKPFASGNENSNFVNPKSKIVYKVNNLMNSLLLSKLFDYVDLHNKIFPLTKYDFVGFTGNKKRLTSIQPIFKQGLIEKSILATPKEIKSFMEGLGFEQKTPESYTNGKYLVFDLYPRNVLKDKNGVMYVIDAEIKKVSDIKKETVKKTKKQGSVSKNQLPSLNKVGERKKIVLSDNHFAMVSSVTDAEDIAYQIAIYKTDTEGNVEVVENIKTGDTAEIFDTAEQVIDHLTKKQRGYKLANTKKGVRKSKIDNDTKKLKEGDKVKFKYLGVEDTGVVDEFGYVVADSNKKMHLENQITNLIKLGEDLSTKKRLTRTAKSKLEKNIDKAISDLDKFGKGNMSMGLPLVVAKGMLKAMKLALVTARVSQDVVKAGVEYVKNTDWYKNLSKQEQLNVLNLTVKSTDVFSIVQKELKNEKKKSDKRAERLKETTAKLREKHNTLKDLKDALIQHVREKLDAHDFVSNAKFSQLMRALNKANNEKSLLKVVTNIDNLIEETKNNTVKAKVNKLKTKPKDFIKKDNGKNKAKSVDNETRKAIGVVKEWAEKSVLEIENEILSVEQDLDGNENYYADLHIALEFAKGRELEIQAKQNKKAKLPYADEYSKSTIHYNNAFEQLKTMLNKGKNTLREQIKKEADRLKEIVIKAVESTNHALSDKSESDVNRIKELRNKWQKAYWSKVSGLNMTFLRPVLSSFEFYAKTLTNNDNPDTNPIYQHFYKGKDGVYQASLNEYVENKDNEKQNQNVLTKIFKTKDNALARISFMNKAREIHTETGIYITRKGKTAQRSHSKLSALTIYQWSKMESMKDNLLEAGYNKKSIEQVKEFLGKEFMEFGDYMTKFMQDGLADTQKKHLEITRTEMETVANYFPVRYNKETHTVEVDLDSENSNLLSSILPSHTITRVSNKNALNDNVDAFELFAEYQRENAHFKHYARVTKDFNALLSNKQFKHNLETLSEDGLFYSQFKQATAEVLGVKAKKPHSSTEKLNRWAYLVTKSVAITYVGFKVWTALKQVISFLAVLEHSKPVYLGKQRLYGLGTARFLGKLLLELRKPRANHKFLMKNSVGYRRRIESGDVGSEVFSRFFADRNNFKKMDYIRAYSAKVGLSPNKLMDTFTIAWTGKTLYNQQLKHYKDSGLSQKEAHRLAIRDFEIYMVTSQQSSTVETLGEIQREKGVMGSLATFKNSQFSYYRKVTEQIVGLMNSYSNEKKRVGGKYAGIKAVKKILRTEKDINKIKNYILYAHVMPMAWQYVASGLPGILTAWDDDDEFEMKRSLYTGAFDGVFILTDFAKFLTDVTVRKKRWQYSPSLFLSELNQLGKDFTKVLKEKGEISSEIAYLAAKYTLKFKGVMDLDTSIKLYHAIEQLLKDGKLTDENVKKLIIAPKAIQKGYSNDNELEEFEELKLEELEPLD